MLGNSLKKNNSGLIGTGGESSQGEKVLDPTVFAISYKKYRFYLFSRREPPIAAIPWDPTLQPLRGDPRFEDLVKRVSAELK